MKKEYRTIALILILTVLLLSMASCAGKFSLSHKLLNWNLSLNKWLGSFLLFIFIVIPVYGVCLLIDWVILNVIEFYSGKNPIDAKATTIEGKAVSMVFKEGKGINVDITTIEKDGMMKKLMVRTTNEGMTARLIEGQKESIITARLTKNGGIERCIDNLCEGIDESEKLATLENIEGIDDLLLETY